MSNLEDLLGGVVGENSEAVHFFGNILGTLADLSGAAGTIVGIVDFFVSQDQNQAVAKLGAIQSTLAANFAALHKDFEAGNILAWENNLAGPLATALSELQSLPASLNQEPPVSNEFRLTQIENCLDAADHFDTDSEWRVSYQYEIYYDDFAENLSWAGRMAPDPDSDGTVFTDRYILPLFMRVLNILVVVTLAYGEDFGSSYRDALRSLTRRLKTACDTSSSGIQNVRLPTVAEAGLDWNSSVEIDANNATDNRHYISSTWSGDLDAGYYWTTPYWKSWQMFGVIHIYSGYSALDNYPPIPLPHVLSPSSDERSARVFTQLALANRARWKDVYLAVGLADAWDAINSLRKLTLDPPQDGMNPGRWWSLREVYDLLGDTYRDPAAAKEVRGYQTILRLTWLATVPNNELAGGAMPPFLSWRNALTLATLRTRAPDPGFGQDL